MLENPKTNLRVILLLITLIILVISLFYMGNLRLSESEVIYENKTKTNQDPNPFTASRSFPKGSTGTLDQVLPLGKVAKPEGVASGSELNILFAGDIMTDRYIRKKFNLFKNSDLALSEAENFNINYLNNLSKTNSNYDYVVANLEGPITENKSLTLNDDGSYGPDLLFTFPTSTSEILNILNIKLVSLANNHTDNFYYQGLLDTKKFLDESDIKYFGNPYNYNSVEDDLSEVVCDNNICIAYIGYNKFTKENKSEIIIREIERIKSSQDTTPSALRAPSPLRTAEALSEGVREGLDSGIDFIVVMAHWGEEYDLSANKIEQEYARAWVDAGADLVIGAHPHVIQDSEVYIGKHIYYSLGNYIIDQWFDPNVKKGLALHFRFTKQEHGKNVELIENKSVSIDRNGVRYLED